MNIVKASMNELDIVTPLFDAYRIFYHQESHPERAREFLAQRIQNLESVIFVAIEDHGKGVGFTQLYPCFSSVSAAKIWILNDLFVASDYRGQGIGKQLLHAAKTMAVAEQVKGIALETTTDNVNAQKLYDSLGYVKESGVYHYFLAV